MSRSAAFLLTLRDSSVRFVAADMPEANDLTVGIMALVAEQEREAISRRTREALAAARARGVRAAGQPSPEAGRTGGQPLRDAIARNADRHRPGPSREDIRSADHRSLGGTADELNARGILTGRGGRWYKAR